MKKTHRIFAVVLLLGVVTATVAWATSFAVAQQRSDVLFRLTVDSPPDGSTPKSFPILQSE